MKHREIIAREGWGFIVFFAVLAMIPWYFNLYWLALLFLLLAAFSLFFFRNPERNIPSGKGDVVAPADGKVMDICTVNEDYYVQGEAIRVRIFLNLFNVHVNRMPVKGEVKWVKQISGKYLPAYKEEVGAENERNYVGIECDKGKILVVQITGLIARRLVCWVAPGQVLERGERLGLIRFGSCTEVYLPPGTQIVVKAGDTVKGGESIIAKFSAE